MKTKRVRAVCLMSSDGVYQIIGWNSATVEKMVEDIYSCTGYEDAAGGKTVRRFVIEADVPVPEQTAHTPIEGEVCDE